MAALLSSPDVTTVRHASAPAAQDASTSVRPGAGTEGLSFDATGTLPDTYVVPTAHAVRVHVAPLGSFGAHHTTIEGAP